MSVRRLPMELWRIRLANVDGSAYGCLSPILHGYQSVYYMKAVEIIIRNHLSPHSYLYTLSTELCPLQDYY